MRAPQLETVELAFFVVPGDRTTTEICRTVGVEVVSIEPQYRDAAVSPWLHNASNARALCVMRDAGHTIIAPPGNRLLSGDARWGIPLSQAYGTCWSFCATEYAPSIGRYENGQLTGETPELGTQKTAPEGLLGVCSPSDGGPVLAALSQLLGVTIESLFEGRMDEVDVITTGGA